MKKVHYILNPLLAWFITIFVALIILAISLRTQFTTFVSADGSNIALIILLLFFVALVLSFVHALTLASNLKYVNQLIKDSPYQDDTYDWDDHEIFRIMRISYTGSTTHTGNNLLGPYLARKNNIPNLISLMSSMLITLGLIGTIVGLIGAVAGLTIVIDSATYSESRLIEGIRETISSMGTAFYTTLFGAFLGGFTLRAISKVLKLSIDSIGSLLFEQIEINNSKSMLENHARNQFAQIEESTMALITSFGKLKEQTDEFTKHMAENISSTVNSQLSRLSKELRSLSETLDQIKIHRK